MNRIQRYINKDTCDKNTDSDSESMYSDSEYDSESSTLNNSAIVLENYSDSGLEHTFNCEWNVWYHHEKNNWKINGFKNIYSIKNIKDFWDFNNNINHIGGINSHHFFMMRSSIMPIWEDDNNKTGGCWSIKIPTEKSYELWVKLSIFLASENIINNDPSIVTGISICAKNPMTSVVKIWNNDNKKNSIKLLPVDILNEYGYNIIYKSHIPEY